MRASRCIQPWSCMWDTSIHWPCIQYQNLFKGNLQHNYHCQQKQAGLANEQSISLDVYVSASPDLSILLSGRAGRAARPARDTFPAGKPRSVGLRLSPPSRPRRFARSYFHALKPEDNHLLISDKGKDTCTKS